MLVRRKVADKEYALDTSQPCGLYFPTKVEHPRHFDNLVTLVEWLRGATRVPGIVQWELLSSCNFECPFCYIVGHSPKRVFDLDRALTLVPEFVDAGTVQVILTGGEPLIHPRFTEIYRSLRSAGLFVSLYTNLSVVSEHTFETLKEMPPYGVEVSIYGDSEDAYERATGRRVFRRTLANLDRVLELGIDLLCKTPVTSLTASSIPWIRSWCEQHSIPYLASPNIEAGLDGADLSRYSLRGSAFVMAERLRIDEACSVTAEAMKDARDPAIAYNCGVGKVGAYLGYDGILSFCARMRSRGFSVYDHSVSDAWQLLINEVVQEEGRPIRGCDPACIARTICRMCPALAILHPDGEYRVDPKYCEKTVNLWHSLHPC